MRTTADQLADVLDHWQSGTGPLYQQLADAIVSLAESGSLEHGSRLPSERALAQRLHLSRNTVTAAYQQLRDQEWLEVTPGAAPRLGSLSRGVMALSPQDRFAQILVGQQPPLVAFNTASPPPAPIVHHALNSPSEFLGGQAVVGNGYAALGDIDLTRAIVEHLRASGIRAQSDEIVITAGGQQAVWLAVTGVASDGGAVALESVTYPGVFDAVAAAGARPMALPMTRDGLDVSAAAKLFKAARPDAAYVTTFHNPTGTAMSDEDAARLVAAAAATDTTIIDDRIIGDISLDGVKRSPMATFPGGKSVITIGGLSKVFWGGLRIGWLHTNATLAAQLRHRRAAMDLGGPAMLQRIGAKLLSDHYDDTLQWRMGELRESLAVAMDVIGQANVDWEYTAPVGGPSLWIRLPDGGAERFAQRSAAAGVPVAPGSAFEVIPGAGADHFRLPFYLPAEDMRLGIKVLADKVA
ncbi:PLP-dependent aminotransferase family protein [Demequina oxidasica]|uniref:aminotransferase-like domain-containing protein n=1 Tax=Demequina oxidasica TaxID=676199 RepID=UPI00078178EE|nr:PLP-dependent aminotransferase family protein [Demequina oxidasica]